MEFITVLIVLALLQLWGSGGPVQRDQWFYIWSKRLSVLPSGPIRLMVLVAVPVIAVLLLECWLEDVLFGLLTLVLLVTTLLYALGRGDYNENFHRYLNAWNHGNFESAYDKAFAMSNFAESAAITDHQSLHVHFRRAFVYSGFERWFAVVFWFLLLGPVGAVLYRLCFMAAWGEGNTEKAEAESESGDRHRRLALQVVHILDWLPARLLTLSFALTGNFVNGIHFCWRGAVENTATDELLDACALAAINGAEKDGIVPDSNITEQQFIQQGREELLALQSLLSRSVVFWMIVLAVLTLVAA